MISAILRPDEGRGGFVGVLVGGDVTEGAEHEAEPAAMLPGLLEDASPLLLGDAHGRHGALLEPEGDGGRLTCAQIWS